MDIKKLITALENKTFSKTKLLMKQDVKSFYMLTFAFIRYHAVTFIIQITYREDEGFDLHQIYPIDGHINKYLLSGIEEAIEEVNQENE